MESPALEISITNTVLFVGQATVLRVFTNETLAGRLTFDVATASQGVPNVSSTDFVLLRLVQLLESESRMELLIASELALEKLDLIEMQNTFFSNIITKARSRPIRVSMGVWLSKFIINTKMYSGL